MTGPGWAWGFARQLDLELAAEGEDRDEGALSALSPGSYEIVCTVCGHIEAGMPERPVAKTVPK